jgi:hypothetical protein
MQQRHQGASLKNMIRRRAAEIFDESRHKIDSLDQRFADNRSEADRT